METLAQEASQNAPSLGRMFRVWLSIGMQSFGGGSATLYLMRRETVERQHWLSDEEFAEYWGICQIAPGINLLGQTILIGWKIARVPGILLALAGLLLPSAAITVLITVAYDQIRTLEVVQTALRGIIPATVGLSVLMAYQMVRSPIVASHSEGWKSLAFSLLLLLGATALIGVAHLPVLAVLWGSGLICAGVLWWWARGR